MKLIVTYSDGTKIKTTKEELLRKIQEVNSIHKLKKFPKNPERFGLLLIKKIEVQR